MDLLLEALDTASAPDRGIYRPEFFRLSLPTDRQRLDAVLKLVPGITIHDELHAQLVELVRTLDPSVKFGKEELRSAAIAHLKGIDPHFYGVWVYYPWSRRLVHLLDEAEFAQVRTDRNRNKITSEEQAILATKKVGVIGLSVGQSVCLTMALERSFGELRIADFDTLELSNLNRIRSGTHAMGNLKTVNVAREIAEIDPFLKVVCFNDGITEANIDAFLVEGGKLDVLVEECDSVDVKIRIRQKAKTLGIPVLMDTSDRGMVDIERFDLEPDRPILHGLVEHLDLSLAAKAKTNEEKLQFVLPIAGMDTLSTRMKASMLEIENSVSTWPQLASSVVLGGALGGHLMRRIGLGHPVTSGRWWVDIDEIIGVPDREPSLDESPKSLVEPTSKTRTLSVEEMVEVARNLHPRKPKVALSTSDATRIAKAGQHAPSGGNSQHWSFLHLDGRLFLFMDIDRARSALDPGLRFAYLGLGACLENMLLEGGVMGHSLVHSFTPDRSNPLLVAVITATHDQVASVLSKQEQRIAEQISVRCTNRKPSETMTMELTDAEELLSSTRRFPGVDVKIIRDRSKIDSIAALCGRAERIRSLNSTCHYDMFVREMRWTDEQAVLTRDGVDLATLEMSLSDRTGLRVASDPKTMSLLKNWGAGHAIEKIASKSVRASSALALISVKDFDLETAFIAGQAMQRFWLKSSSMEIIAHPVGAPIFMGLHGKWDHGILSHVEHSEAGGILDELKELTDSNGTEPFFMFRLGRASSPTARSLRLPLSDRFHSVQKSHS